MNAPDMEAEPTPPRHVYPILEFDSSRHALIEPARTIKPIDAPECCVICFFQETLAKVFRERPAKTIATIRWEDGPHSVYEIEVDGKRLAVLHPGVGAPTASAMLEQTIALGCRKFIACGGAGVLDRDIVVGHILVPATAVRDEGTSYHYLPPAREVGASANGIAAIERVLRAEQIEYLISKTWTTDAPYRETPAKIRLRKAEGCLTVEMEAAAFFAVAQFRDVTFAQMLYGGDDVSGSEWNSRQWQTRAAVRERIFWLAVKACLAL